MNSTYKVIVERNGNFEAVSLDAFEKEYNMSPRYTGDMFYMPVSQDRDYIIYKFPNPACIFIEGKFRYIIYKGQGMMVVNGMLMPNADFIPEDRVFGSLEEVMKMIHDREDAHRGEIYINII